MAVAQFKFVFSSQFKCAYILQQREQERGRERKVLNAVNKRGSSRACKIIQVATFLSDFLPKYGGTSETEKTTSPTQEVSIGKYPTAYMQ